MNNIQHVFPFLWLKGEDKNLILEEIIAIQNSGLNAFCIESRIHPDFCGERWFSDVRFILEEAKKRNMQVWILDDFSYPTGYARGVIMKERPDLKGWQIALGFVDVAGEIRNAKFPISLDEKNNESLLGVFMAKRSYDETDDASIIDVTEKVKDGVLYTNVPYGAYRIFFLTKTQGCAERDNYVDMLNPKSTSLFLEVIYEEHYKNLSEYFGNTLVGFFSDEPRLCNGFNAKGLYFKPVTFCDLGNLGVAYPYSDELAVKLGVSEPKKWLNLWLRGEGFEKFRCDYMTQVTKLYSENFCYKLSEWCHKHGVLYSGHIIEDNGAHLRTVCSSGHYFRSMEGADMSGIDIVLHQIKPYDTLTKHRAYCAGGYADAIFFNFLLAKLATSSANLDPYKNGKALCELFGAYGWRESTFEMLYLVNHLLSRGINYFIPHAFSMSDNDKDCPPHFYARGKNPAYEGYGVLFRYMDEMGKLFSDGTSFSEVAVLYHDEAEWSGRGYEPCEVIAKILTENQIDFDIVYSDFLRQAKRADDGITINGRKFKYIIIPSAEYITPETVSLLKRFNDRVIYCGKIPDKDIGTSVPKSALIKRLLANGVFRAVKKSSTGLRLYRYLKNSNEYTFCFNEEGREISFSFAGNDDVYALDTATRRVYLYEKGKNIKLKPAQAILCGDFAKNSYKKQKPASNYVDSVDVYIKPNEKTEFEFYKKVCLPFDINANNELENFCGEVQFRFTLDLDDVERLEIDYDGEFCKLECLDALEISIGGRLEADLSKLKGKSTVAVTIANTLGYKYKYEWYSELTYLTASCLYSIKY